MREIDRLEMHFGNIRRAYLDSAQTTDSLLQPLGSVGSTELEMWSQLERLRRSHRQMDLSIRAWEETVVLLSLLMVLTVYWILTVGSLGVHFASIDDAVVVAAAADH